MQKLCFAHIFQTESLTYCRVPIPNFIQKEYLVLMPGQFNLIHINSLDGGQGHQNAYHNLKVRVLFLMHAHMK